MKKLTVLFFTLSLFYSSIANTFIVTSNADSGPGTLREALTLAAANGTTLQDFITFNLATDAASRTFNILSELPALSSNLVIDASTQPGVKFGISDTKIILSYNLPAAPANGFFFDAFSAENTRDIEIYGIYFRSYSSVNGYTGVGVYCNNTINIRIGAPGKGNLFAGWLTGVGHPEGFEQPFIGSDSVFIQSNIFGLLEDGNTTTYDVNGIANLFDVCCKFAISLKGSSDIKIGGATAAEGNLINFSVCAVSLTDPPLVANGFFIIQNNNIGCNVSKTMCVTADHPNYECIHAEQVNGLQITGNMIMGVDREAGIYLIESDNFSIKGNIIDADINGNKCNSVMNEGIIIFNCNKGIIGGDQPADKNIVAFTNNTGGMAIAGSDITISRNSTYCNTGHGSINILGNGITDPTKAPFVSILAATANSVSGKALPGSTVELFVDDSCPLCEGKLYVSSVTADQNGNWIYTGANTNDIVATSTDINGSTSEFSIAKINHSLVPVVKPASCGLQNGSITNVQILSGTNWHWEDEAGNVVGTDTTLHNAAPGKYRLVVELGGHYCSYKTDYFEITSVTLPSSLTPIINDATCGLNNGSLSISYKTTDYIGKWLNSSNDSIGTGLLIDKVLPGNYYLKLSAAADTGCNNIFGPYQVMNQSGPSLNTNNIQLTAATCSNSNGSIMGITSLNTTGTAFIQWVDSLNKPVANGYDLLNVPPGKYKLKFKDASGCDTIITSFYTINNTGAFSIDTSGKIITGSKCSGISGSIQQIKVTGGETYQWINTSTNAVAGSFLDLLNVAPGSYQLQINNHFGCSKTLPPMIVPQSVFASITVTSSIITDALCNQPDGIIKITSFSKDSALYNFHWADSSSGQTTGYGTALSNIGAGVYQLLAKDSNGCEQKIFSAGIKTFPVPTFNYLQAQVNNDNCNLHEGSVAALMVNGLKGPTVYTWHDQLNNIAGNNISLQNVAAGTYILNVTDAGICSIQSTPFTITNSNVGLTPPVYQDLIIPRYSDAQLSVKNAAAGNYSLTLNSSGTSVLQQNNTGNFIIPKVGADTSFYVELVSGDCVSSIVKVNIKVVDKSFLVVPNAFTPNGDGRNDRLSVKVIGYIQLSYFRIFNRWGSMIFETHNINDGWDGRLNGILQDPGGFMWTAKGKDINGNILSGKGSFILIR